ncbi:MAG TPA: bifunctional serine/threonine-protein kinase/formylglycine-generating enzyme family protein [Gemmataceae bacterium]|nr:bifunctional serine/threonine-protein kinase/formylglycine-generating enzyme family protein [Gemmataceae bacterium]
MSPDDATEAFRTIDRYQLRELLGAGAFGCVYRAFDPRLERDVALKVLRPGRTSSREAVERFLREAKAAAKLVHPHIVPVYDAGRDQDAYYIASAFIRGRTLAAALPVGGMAPRQAAELVAQLASALGYAHQHGVLHRDVKPENILVDEQGRLHLTDFGLAACMHQDDTRLTQDGAIIGTPVCMAPEQAAGVAGQIGPRSDLYSAGVVLYRLLTGRLPFDAPHWAALVYQVVNVPPPPPSRFRPDLDGALEALCLKALAKRPEERFDSGEAMAAALADWAAAAPRPGSSAIYIARLTSSAKPAPKNAAGPPASVTPFATTAPAEGRRGVRISRRWVLGAVVSAVVLAAAITVYFVAYRRSSPPEETRAGRTAPLRALGPFDAVEAKQLQQAWAEHLDAPLYREVDLGDGVAMRLALIPPGSFQMGSPDGERDHRVDEKRHAVEISQPFYLGVCETTKRQFAAFVEAEKYLTEAEMDGRGGCGYNAATRALDQDPKYSWRNVGYSQSDDDPVVNVSWNDAARFCQWLSKKAKTRCELPTEAEWEYACRAGTGTRFWCGGQDEDLKGAANVADASLVEKYPRATWAVPWDSGYPFTAPGGMFRANPWGLYDMHGNAWEWCTDYYDADYYGQGPMKDPVNLQQRPARVQRGGSWHDGPPLCRSAFRLSAAPDTRNFNVGLRVVVRLP